MPVCVRCARVAATAEMRRLPRQAWSDPYRFACRDKAPCQVRVREQRRVKA